MAMSGNDRRLIEDYLPIEAISADASREKRTPNRKGHMATLHLWWARRPLVACRAAVYGALVIAHRFQPENAPPDKRGSLGRANALPGFFVTVALAGAVAVGGDSDSLGVLKRVVESDPRPFVLVEARGTGFVGKGQGVVVSSRGHVLSAGHVSWDHANQRFVDTFRVSFRTANANTPPGAVHSHKAVFVDREGAAFYEHRYAAELLKQGRSRFIANRDLCLLKINAEAAFPKVQFFSDTRPGVKIGDVLHLCHYNWPMKDADPTFLISPVEVVGVVQTTSGPQYLARGYYRWGSSGGAILKDGRLIGIQSAAYTVNAKDIGEMPLGLLSFQIVWRSMFAGLLESNSVDRGRRSRSGTTAQRAAPADAQSRR